MPGLKLRTDFFYDPNGKVCAYHVDLWNLLEIKGIHGDAWHLIIHVGGKLEKACVAVAIAKLPIGMAQGLNLYIGEDAMPLIAFSGRLFVGGGHDGGPACRTREFGDGCFLRHAAYGRQ